MGAATTAPESAREQEKPKGIVARCRTLLALAFGYFIDQGEAQAMPVLFPTLQALWGLSYSQLLILRAISGIGLGCLMPATFSLVADRFAPQRRGRGLGILASIGVLGIIAGALADRIGLTKAMVRTVTVPWILCAAIFSLLYITYPQDAARLRGLMAERAEAL